MAHWKQIISRLTLSTVSLAIITGIGGFIGAIAGGLFELLTMALFNTALPALEVIPAFMALGIGTAFLWGLRIVLQNARPALTRPQSAGETQPAP